MVRNAAATLITRSRPVSGAMALSGMPLRVRHDLKRPLRITVPPLLRPHAATDLTTPKLAPDLPDRRTEGATIETCTQRKCFRDHSEIEVPHHLYHGASGVCAGLRRMVCVPIPLSFP